MMSFTLAPPAGFALAAEVAPVAQQFPCCVLRCGPHEWPSDVTIHFSSADSLIEWARRAIDGAERLKSQAPDAPALVGPEAVDLNEIVMGE